MSVTTYPPRRKPIRAAQACDACRQRKAKCDEGRPLCGFCKEAMIPCVYREVPPPKQDRTLIQILQKLEKLEKLDRIDNELQEIRSQIGTAMTNGDRRDPPSPADKRQTTMTTTTTSTPTPTAVVTAAVAPGADQPASIEARRTAKVTTDALGGEPSKPKESPADGELSIPIEHTTAAHKLLRWPSIQHFVHPITRNEHYVMEGEYRRGLLRVWGRGEGGDLPDNNNPLSLFHPGASSDRDEVTRGGLATPAFSRGDSITWGPGGPSRPALSDSRRPPPPVVEGIGGLAPDGSLKLETSTLVRLMTSYLNNIHILHPFMDEDRLTSMICALGNRYFSPGPGQPRSPYAAPSVLVPSEMRRESVALVKAGKRKRSSGALGGGGLEVWGCGLGGNRTPPERSIGAALVLLVAALGKICEHKDYLPGPVPDQVWESESVAAPTTTTTTMTDSSTPARVDSPPVSVKQSPTPSHSSGLNSTGSPVDGPRVSFPGRSSSLEEVSPADRGSPPINADVIPGLAYYAYATDILGNLHGGNDLPHVQAGLLAGLYAGQLGRAFESWKWISSACMNCLVLVKRYWHFLLYP